MDSFVEERLAAAVAKPSPTVEGDEDKRTPEVPKSPLFEIIGIFSEPIEGIEPDCKERHDEMVAEEAMDPHADAEK